MSSGLVRLTCETAIIGGEHADVMRARLGMIVDPCCARMQFSSLVAMSL
jgi:hypothetical protein